MFVPVIFCVILGRRFGANPQRGGSEMTPWQTLALLEQLAGLNNSAYFVVESVKKVCSIDTCYQSHTTDFVVCDA